ncbi:hypothetical protein GW17_00019854, partial [Ensete ventricosum]
DRCRVSLSPLFSFIGSSKEGVGGFVFEGVYDTRPVAVKRLLRAHHDVACKEIQNLIASDQHPNIVRWYGFGTLMYHVYSQHFQETLGPVPEGFDMYFTSRFPKLLIEVYRVVCRYCKEEDSLGKYFRSSLL